MPRPYCPECEAQLYGECTACECGWYEREPLERPTMPAHAAAAPEPQLPRYEPTPEAREAIKRAARADRHTGPYWRPEVVVNEAQVAFVCRQALHGGSMSPAGRFLDECIAAGSITRDHKLGRMTKELPWE